MKHLSILLFSILLFSYCANTPDRPAPVMTPEQHARVDQESAALKAQRDAQAAAASASGGGLQHYYCANHPAEGGGAAGTCSQCGSAYVHNQAFHNTPASTPTATPGATGTVTPPVSTPEPAVNAAGVYHYTCPNGHAGGGGSATPCAECGTTLVHNAAYHN